ncbi:MAG: helix-hairpin-helix domain-containing protein [Bacilli bacterium]|nr:helix-hairpin-helix domain-containing protein [Bacilli bacterium]
MEKIKENLKYIIPIFILVIISVIIVILYYPKEEPKAQIVKVKKQISNKEVKEEKYYYVDIKGAVNNPGVYKLKEDSRVIDAINNSGGLKENADTSIINLSKKIEDEMVIIIYSKEDLQKYKDNLSTKKIEDEIKKEIISIDKNNKAEINIDLKEDNSKININTASKEELTTLPGVGESKAEAIIKYREDNGNYEKIEDIKNVSGIGESAFEKIKDNITV